LKTADKESALRIAMLSPIDWRTPPEQFGPPALFVSLLTEALVTKGVDVTLFATADSVTKAKLESVCPEPMAEANESKTEVWRQLHVANLFEHANEYDLIHNHCGHLPLTYASLVETPLLTTIYGAPSRAAMEIFRRYNGRVFFAAENRGEGLADLDNLQTIEYGIERKKKIFSDDPVDNYITLYQDILKRRAREDHRPWGFYEVLSDRTDHKVKRITVYPGKRLSYQRHRQRSEHWHLVEGEALVTLDGRQVPLSAEESIDIPRKSAHRVENPGNRNMVFIEVQHGEYFGEDDIERLEDDFGRT
jgi:mannose-6-phosphate isomerase-like protein (cupin superfamily)